MFETCGGSLRQSVGTIAVDQRGRTRRKAKESMSTRRIKRAKGKRIAPGLAPSGDRQRTPAKQLEQGTSGGEQGTQNFQGDTLSEGRPTTRRQSIPRYGARSVLSPTMSQRAPEIGFRSLGRYTSLRRHMFEVLNAFTAGARLSARPSLHHSSDLP